MRFGNEYGKHGRFRDQLIAVVQSVRAPISLRSIRRDEPAAPRLQRRQRLHLSGCFACANRLERLLIRPKGAPNRRDRIQLFQEFRTRSFSIQANGVAVLSPGYGGVGLRKSSDPKNRTVAATILAIVASQGGTLGSDGHPLRTHTHRKPLTNEIVGANCLHRSYKEITYRLILYCLEMDEAGSGQE